MTRIFISYRRSDSGAYAGRLYDQLRAEFGKDNVFMDIDTIEPGVDFVTAIKQAVSACDIVLALIGKQWVTITDATGQRRLENPGDVVRLEIVTALERDIRVIPVLVQGASIPRAEQLPEPLKRLARRNAQELSDSRWRYDVERLMTILKKALQPQELADLWSQFTQAEAQAAWDAMIALGERILQVDARQPIHTQMARVYSARGQGYRDKGEADRAIADCNRALERDPNLALVYFNRGASYHNKGEYDRAIADYNRALERDPNLALVYFNRGLAYKGKKDMQAARRDFQHAAALGYEAAEKELSWWKLW